MITGPAAFTRQTGAAHWHVLQRARAIENGAFLVSAAQGGLHEDGRETYGHSIIVSPWGEVLAEADHDEPGVILADIDVAQSAEARAKIPNEKCAGVRCQDFLRKAERGSVNSMIRFSLHCDQGHDFEGWFRDNADFDRQSGMKLVACPVCNSQTVQKSLMAPAVSTSRGKEKIAMTLGETQKKILDEMRELSRKVRENTDYVGDRFAEEAERFISAKPKCVVFMARLRARMCTRCSKTASTFCRCRYFLKTRTDSSAGGEAHETDGFCAFLLIATGTLLGLILPLGKIAAQAGVPPAMWTFLFSASAGLILSAVLLLQGKSVGFSGGRLRYYICTAIISYALPNLLILSAIPRLGAGFTGIMYTLSPVITLLLSMGFGLRRPNGLGIGGIAVGFIGAVMVAMTRGEVEARRSALDRRRIAHSGFACRRQYLSYA